MKDVREKYAWMSKQDILREAFLTTSDNSVGPVVYRDDFYIDILLPTGEETTLQRDIINYRSSTSQEKMKWLEETLFNLCMDKL